MKLVNFVIVLIRSVFLYQSFLDIRHFCLDRLQLWLMEVMGTISNVGYR